MTGRDMLEPDALRSFAVFAEHGNSLPPRLP